MLTRYVEDLAGLRDCYRDVAASVRVAYDMETTGLSPRDDFPLLLQFCGEAGTAWVVPVNAFATADLTKLLRLLADPARIVLAHNAAFEYQFTLTHYGVKIGRVFDTMLAEGALTAGLVHLSTDLGSTLLRRLSLDVDKDLQKSFIGADPATFSPTPEQIAYAAGDVLHMHALRAAQVAALQTEGLVKVAALEFDCLRVFAEMQLHGLTLDLDAHAQVLHRYTADAEHYGVVAAGVLDPFWRVAGTARFVADTEATAALNGQIEAILPGGRAKKDTPEDVKAAVADLRKERAKVKPSPVETINLKSGAQVLAALAESGVSLPDLKAETVEEHAHKSPVLQAYAKYVKAQKIVSTYGETLRAKVHPATGRVHGHYNQMVSTGRTSSSDPNMQNMPKDIRACFKPAPGNVFVVADFAAMEMRIAAGMSGDPTLLDALNTGKDPHCMTAAAAWPEKYPTWEDVPKDSKHRADAKTANFTSIYGGSAEALYYRGLIADLATARAVVGGIETAYPVLWQWINDNGEQAVHTGYALTALGRKRYFIRLAPCPTGWAEKRDWKKQRSRIVRQAMNHPVQGTGADIAKRAMVLIRYELIAQSLARSGSAPGGRIVGMVHDEIIVEAPQEIAERVAEIVGLAMQAAGAELIRGVEIPADVHIVDAWVK